MLHLYAPVNNKGEQQTTSSNMRICRILEEKIREKNVHVKDNCRASYKV